MTLRKIGLTTRDATLIFFVFGTGRMNMIPFGAGNADSTAFPVPSYEEPHRAFALNFTYNNLGYNWGDYIDRRDNKSAPMRPSRQMFADVYLPPTK